MASRKEVEPHKLFTASAKALMRQIDITFPNEIVTKTIQDALNEFSAKACKTPHVPAMKFFSSMNIPTGIPDGKGGIVPLRDMILNHDSRMFSDECNMKIPELEAIDLKAKWKVLSDENREVMWQYLERMARLAFQVADRQVQA